MYQLFALSADTGLLWLHAGGCILNVWGGGLGPWLCDSFFYAPRRAPLMPLQLKPMERLCGGLSMFLAWKRIGVSWPPAGAGLSKLSL